MKHKCLNKCVLFIGLTKPALVLRWIRFKFSLFLLNHRIGHIGRIVKKLASKYEPNTHVFVVPYEGIGEY